MLSLVQATRSTPIASSSLPSVTPSACGVRVKPEPGTAAASSEGTRQKDPNSKGKRTGGGRDGYAVKQTVLDDDWEDELEEVGDDLGEPWSTGLSLQCINLLLKLFNVADLGLGNEQLHAAVWWFPALKELFRCTQHA